MTLPGFHQNTRMVFQVYRWVEQTILSTLMRMNKQKVDSERLLPNITGALEKSYHWPSRVRGEMGLVQYNHLVFLIANTMLTCGVCL